MGVADRGASWWAGILDVVFPPRCVACGSRGTPLCGTCLATITPPDGLQCAGCQRLLPADARVGLCPRCAEAGAMPLDGVLVAARYDGVSRRAIWALKYGGQRRLAEPLGDLLAGLVGHVPVGADLVVPIPLHATRRRRRGYNQAELLASRCAAALGLEMRADVVRRVRETPPQVGLGAVARRDNVAGAFALAHGMAPHVVGRHVLLIDDVRTTGATMSAAAAPLRAAGAASVWGLTIAQPRLGDDAAAPVKSARIRETFG